MATLEELRAQVAAMEEASRKVGQEEYKIMRDAAAFEWRVKRTKYKVLVECRYDAESRQRYADWRKAFPNTSVVNPREPDKWHGMEYVFGYTKDGEPFLAGRGGSIILDLKDRFFSNPVAITPEQAAQFEQEIVPEELKKPW